MTTSEIRFTNVGWEDRLEHGRIMRFGSQLFMRTCNEEFRTVEWEVISGDNWEPNEKPSCLDVRQRQTRNPLNEFK